MVYFLIYDSNLNFIPYQLSYYILMYIEKATAKGKTHNIFLFHRNETNIENLQPNCLIRPSLLPIKSISSTYNEINNS